MTDELRRAAERMVGAFQMGKQLFPELFKAVGDDMLSDALKLARRYLAEHRADDGEPWDDAFLLSVGFSDVLSDDKVRVFDAWIDGEYSHALMVVNGEWSSRGMRIPAFLWPKTKGDVRRLCQKAGVPLPEPPRAPPPP